MNIKLRSKRVLIPAGAVIAAFGVGGAFWAASADNSVDGAQRDKVASAAVSAVGGGQATEVETSDDKGEAYEVEVRKSDGTEVDVTLDKNLKVVQKHDDGRDGVNDDRDADEGDSDDRDDVNDDRDADDRALSAAERSSASKAALEAVGGGTVTKVEAGDGPEAYEVEVRDAKGAEWDVDLDAGFAVIKKSIDR